MLLKNWVQLRFSYREPFGKATGGNQLTRDRPEMNPFVSGSTIFSLLHKLEFLISGVYLEWSTPTNSSVLQILGLGEYFEGSVHHISGLLEVWNGESAWVRGQGGLSAWELAAGLLWQASWVLGCHFGILSQDNAILRGLSKWRNGFWRKKDVFCGLGLGGGWREQTTCYFICNIVEQCCYGVPD